ncbi:cation:proton antiporter [Ferroacidibacillus organovorans]|uniref:cation:proton antiporter domain-containing protein n=1 Tax=Ferroacidibacillus organovorans TaxID=1765683 RepID=UPI0015C45EDA|nr:cation:proton antiporter [Ferroacidibacillus organovorans]
MSLTALEVLRFLLEFLVLLVCARVLGELARRLNQPQVIGELLAGVLIGPSLFGAISPSLFANLFPSKGAQGLLLQLIAQIGVIFLLLLSGLETNLEVVKRKLKPALTISIGSIITPFLAGYCLASLLPAALIAHPGARQIFMLFVATAMSISAIPVIVKILLDMNLMKRDIGQLILASGIINDTIGWFLLAFVSGMATSQNLQINSLMISIFGTLAFAVFCFTIGYRMIRALTKWVDNQFGGESPVFTLVVVLGLAGGAVTEALHVEAFLGSFLVGIQMARVPRITRATRIKLEGMTLAIFAPIFFATAGLKVNILQILKPELLLVLLLVIVTASLAKLVGTYAGARLARLNHWTAISLGSGMNARGAVEIIIATLGLQIGVLTTSMYTIIVIMAIATSMMAPPLLRWALRHVAPDPEEAERLQRQSLEEKSFLYGLKRMLVPVRDGRIALLAADIIQHLSGQRSIEATLLHVTTDGLPESGRINREDNFHENEKLNELVLAKSLSSIKNVEWEQKTRKLKQDEHTANVILSESERGYDLLVVGASRNKSGSSLFGHVVDYVVMESPCNVFVLYAPWRLESISLLKRILLPTTGTTNDLRTAEFAVALAKAHNAEITAIYVVETNPLKALFSSESLDMQAMESAENMGWHAISEVTRLGEASNVPVNGIVKTGTGGNVGHEIVEFSNASQQDIILLNAERRPAGGDLYCGHTVDRIVRTVKCPVGILFSKSSVFQNIQ